MGQVVAEPVPFLQPGETAPRLTLRDLDDQAVAFPVAGRWTLVFFWSLFCHSCLEEMPVMVTELAALPGRPCESFFVSLDTARMKKGLRNYLRKRNLDCRVLLEEIASDAYLAADQWGVRTTPALFLVDPDGKIAFSREGPFPLEELFERLRALPVNDGVPSATMTREIGSATLPVEGVAGLASGQERLHPAPAREGTTTDQRGEATSRQRPDPTPSQPARAPETTPGEAQPGTVPNVVPPGGQP